MSKDSMNEKNFPLPTTGGRFERDATTGALTKRPDWTDEEAADFKKAETARATEAEAVAADAKPDARLKKG